MTIRRDGDQVIWDRWRNRNGPGPDLPAFRFDARHYEDELDRAERDHGGE